MTGKEVADMIEKSKERVRELKEKGILDTKKQAYHEGYQDALNLVLFQMNLEKMYEEEYHEVVG